MIYASAVPKPQNCSRQDCLILPVARAQIYCSYTNGLPVNKSSHFSKCLMAMAAVLASVGLDSPLPLSASQMRALTKLGLGRTTRLA